MAGVRQSMWLLGASLVLGLPSEAGELFVNGLPARGIENLEIHNVTVRFDANGDMHVAAPAYDVSELPTDEVPRQPRGEGVSHGQWWLVSDDKNSTAHSAEVWIGGVKVAEIRSGAPPIMLDIAPHLWRGSNVVTVRGNSGVNGSGTLAIYVGQARVEAGTLSLENPAISIFCRSACPSLHQEFLNVP